MTIILKNKETLNFQGFYFKCCIGKKGLTNKKLEGDKKTPKGTFSLGNLYYRKKKIRNQLQNLNVYLLQKIWVGVMTVIIKNITIN